MACVEEHVVITVHIGKLDRSPVELDRFAVERGTDFDRAVIVVRGVDGQREINPCILSLPFVSTHRTGDGNCMDIAVMGGNYLLADLCPVIVSPEACFFKDTGLVYSGEYIARVVIVERFVELGRSFYIVLVSTAGYRYSRL